MQGFVDAVIYPSISFYEIFAAIGDFFNAFATNPGVLGLCDAIVAAVGVALPYVHIISLAFCLLVTFFGKKIFSLLRFLAFLAVGYAVGVVIVAPLIIPIMPTLPDWAVGVVIGFISAIVSKFLYFIGIAVTVGYAVYMAFFQGFLSFAANNAIIALLLAIGAVVLVFVLRKYIEMIVTSALGAWGVASVITVWWDYTKLSFLVGVEWVGIFIVAMIIGVLGFIVQFKTRERY